MVIIPAGSFMMGASSIESGTNSAEGPQRLVNIRKVAVGKFDITPKEWAAFEAATNHPTSGGCSWSDLANDISIKPWDTNPAANGKNLGFPQTDSHPAVCLTWKDVQDYIKWLSKEVWC